ncbi:hypothetical protein [Nocardia sp. BMG51109]|uniref:hypothetical protein n=1 Tax=Nocardia sp. BMG51109 TaxID=1056816 RepID=UPI0004B7D1E9|nr:hypothetical protein [Nocardia sp. BMG51109]
MGTMITTDPDPHAPTTPLIDVYSKHVTVDPPFDAEATLNKPSHFPSPIEVRGTGTYQFVTEVAGQNYGCIIDYLDGSNDVDITLYRPKSSSADDQNHPRVLDEIQRRLGFTVGLDGYEAIWEQDTILSDLPRRMVGARPSSPFSLFEFLIICTVLQNTVVRRTVQMMNTLALEFGTRYTFPSGQAIWGLGRPDQLADIGEARLRELKLGYRAKTVTRLARHFLDNPTLTDDLLTQGNPSDTVQALKEIYGVGPASAGYISFEWLKCLDQFDHVSPWEHKILTKVLFDSQEATPPELIRFCQKRWSPFTMLAVHAVFESLFWRRERGDGPEWLDPLIRL